jgi:hypothetical protein
MPSCGDAMEPAAEAHQRGSGPVHAPDPVQEPARRSVYALARWPIDCSSRCTWPRRCPEPGSPTG